MLTHSMKNKKLRYVFSIIAVIVSALLQTYVIQAFINPSNLLSSGFTGVAILIDKISS
ncbi:MAG: YitT family protein, partial [Longicatena sp.]